MSLRHFYINRSRPFNREPFSGWSESDKAFCISLLSDCVYLNLIHPDDTSEVQFFLKQNHERIWTKYVSRTESDSSGVSTKQLNTCAEETLQIVAYFLLSCIKYKRDELFMPLYQVIQGSDIKNKEFTAFVELMHADMKIECQQGEEIENLIDNALLQIKAISGNAQRNSLLAYGHLLYAKTLTIKAVEEAPNQPISKETRGAIIAKLKKATEHIGAAKLSRANYILQYYVAKNLAKLGDYENSVALLNEIVDNAASIFERTTYQSSALDSVMTQTLAQIFEDFEFVEKYLVCGKCYYQIANVYFMQNQNDKALDCARKARAFFEFFGKDKYYILACRILKAHIYLQTNKLSEFRRLYDELIQLIDKEHFGSLSLELKALDIKYYILSGNLKKANKIYDSHPTELDLEQRNRLSRGHVLLMLSESILNNFQSGPNWPLVDDAVRHNKYSSLYDWYKSLLLRADCLIKTNQLDDAKALIDLLIHEFIGLKSRYLAGLAKLYKAECLSRMGQQHQDNRANDPIIECFQSAREDLQTGPIYYQLLAEYNLCQYKLKTIRLSNSKRFQMELINCLKKTQESNIRDLFYSILNALNLHIGASQFKDILLNLIFDKAVLQKVNEGRLDPKRIDDGNMAVVSVQIGNLHSAEDLCPGLCHEDLLNEFHSVAVDMAKKFDGDLLNSAGGKVVCLFGKSGANNILPNALDFSLELKDWLPLSPILKSAGGHLPLLIGISKGQVKHGFFGGCQRVAYDIVGKPMENAEQLINQASFIAARQNYASHAVILVEDSFFASEQMRRRYETSKAQMRCNSRETQAARQLLGWNDQLQLKPPEKEPLKKPTDKILNSINLMGMELECFPGNFLGKNENELRNAFIFGIGFRLGGIEVTGESLTHGKKTDILFRRKNKNLLIVECKFWNSRERLIEAVNQLLSQAPPRNKDVALLLFIRNKTNYIEVTKRALDIVKSHKLHSQYIHSHSDTWHSFTFHRPDGSDNQINLSLLTFYYPN